MTQDERLEALTQLTKITEHAARAFYLELFAPLINPEGLTAQILKLASTASLSEEGHHRLTLKQQAVIARQAQAALSEASETGDEEEGPITVKAVKRGRLAKGRRGISSKDPSQPSMCADDPRRIQDWKEELLGWAISREDVLDLDQYREEKFVKDYPGKPTTETRYPQAVSELRRKNMIRPTGPRMYEVTDKGRQYMNTSTIPNTPTPPPEPPPPFPPVDYTPEPSDLEETPVVNKAITPQARGAMTRAARRVVPGSFLQRLTDFAKKNNGIVSPAQFRADVKAKGSAAPGAYLDELLNNADHFQKLGHGEYRLKGFNTNGEPPLGEAIREAALADPQHRININSFRKGFEKKWKKRPGTMEPRVRAVAASLSSTGVLRRLGDGVYELTDPTQQQLPLNQSNAANA